MFYKEAAQLKYFSRHLRRSGIKTCSFYYIVGFELSWYDIKTHIS
jgi:hypothetical protein